MALNASSPAAQHAVQNLGLIIAAFVFVPICTFIALGSSFISLLVAVGRSVQKSRIPFSHALPQPFVVLVTGVGMSKGLFIARAFSREGHTVIGADFEPFGIPVCGRYSKALKRFYRLPQPFTGPEGSKKYADELLKIIRKEKVDLWVSCSGVASAMEDAEAAAVVERMSTCKTIQFHAKLTETLHEKHLFIQQTQDFGLNVPETHLINSVEDAMEHVYGSGPQSLKSSWIMKPIGVDDSMRADMTLLPRRSHEETSAYLERLNPHKSQPYVLQQFIDGPEYCTHSIVIRGNVVAFTACQSAEILMHYQALPPSSRLFRAMRKFTEDYVEKLGKVSGHFSIDFMLNGQEDAPDLTQRLYPIECNPRAHTAVLLFEAQAREMVNAYLSIFNEGGSMHSDSTVVVMPAGNTRYYWIGHDLVTCLIHCATHLSPPSQSMPVSAGEVQKLIDHLINWKDGTYDFWDPWPFWWLYCVTWPGLFLEALVKQDWWSRCNVSTMKLFRCNRK